MKKLVPCWKATMIVGIVSSLISLILFLIFGRPEEKLSTAIGTVIIVPLFYLFIKFMFYIVGKNGTDKMLKVYSWFFMLGGIIAVLMGIISFFNPFPTNSILLITAGFTLVTSILFNYSKLKKI